MKIIINQNKKLNELKKDIEFLGDSINDVMKQGDSKVKIKLNKHF